MLLRAGLRLGGWLMHDFCGHCGAGGGWETYPSVGFGERFLVLCDHCRIAMYEGDFDKWAERELVRESP